MVDHRSVFHAICFGFYAYTCWFDAGLISGDLLPISGNFFSKFVWLTMVDLYLQTFYHLWGIFSPSCSCNKAFHYTAKVLVGPIGLSVVLLFWALYTLDPDFLLHDENAKKIIAITWFNNAIHSAPALTVFLDTILWQHGRITKGAAVTGITIFAILYLIDIHYVHYISGFWAYPILGLLPLPARALFIVACVAVFFIQYVFLDTISGWIHGVPIVEPAKKHGKKHH
ncbi:unnamed protein product, partial [Mesorhabditis belari]|uniref:Androgen-induced 1 n=1 Tax=Mesorhabditis belari TaxID=2138241 RepID=A0AAF3FNE5_9BILA